MPSRTPITKQTILDRIKVSKSGCWLWALSLTPNGYARLTRNKRTVLIHRKAYELWVGPTDLQINHRRICPHKHCVNPAHLYAGTQSENMRDVSSKKGYVNSQQQYTDEELKAAIETYKKVKSLTRTAKITGISRTHINNVLRGRRRSSILNN